MPSYGCLGLARKHRESDELDGPKAGRSEGLDHGRTISGDKNSGVTVGGRECGDGIKVSRVPEPQHRHC